MYYAYIFGCNKHVPKLLFGAPTYELLISKIEDKTGAEFMAIVNQKVMREQLSEMNELDPNSEEVDFQIISGDIPGPGKDNSDNARRSGDWYIEKKYASKLVPGWADRCSCKLVNFSIFYFNNDTTIDFEKLEGAIYEFIN